MAFSVDIGKLFDKNFGTGFTGFTGLWVCCAVGLNVICGFGGVEEGRFLTGFTGFMVCYVVGLNVLDSRLFTGVAVLEAVTGTGHKPRNEAEPANFIDDDLAA